MDLRWLLTALATLAVTACLPWQPLQWRAVSYRLVEIGDVFAADMNEAGQVVGYTRGSTFQPVVWDPVQRQIRILPPPFLPCIGGSRRPVVPFGKASGINAAGDVVGHYAFGICDRPLETRSPAFQPYEVFALKWPATGGGPQVLAGGWNGTWWGAIANDINDSGEIVGGNRVVGPEGMNRSPGGGNAWRWTPAGGSFAMAENPPQANSQAMRVNSAGLAVGTVGPYNLHDGVAYYNRANFGLLVPTPPQTYVVEIVHLNDRGQIVFTPNNGPSIFSVGDQLTTDLGAGSAGWANAINNHGQVVGSDGDRAFIWDAATGKQDLNELIFPCDPLAGKIVLYSARAINDRGRIAATALDGRAFLLEPTTIRCVLEKPPELRPEN